MTDPPATPARDWTPWLTHGEMVIMDPAREFNTYVCQFYPWDGKTSDKAAAMRRRDRVVELWNALRAVDDPAAFMLAVRELVKAAENSITEMMTWREVDECDCPPEGHICGRPRLDSSIRKSEEALARLAFLLEEEPIITVVELKGGTIEIDEPKATTMRIPPRLLQPLPKPEEPTHD